MFEVSGVITMDVSIVVEHGIAVTVSEKLYEFLYIFEFAVISPVITI